MAHKYILVGEDRPSKTAAVIHSYQCQKCASYLMLFGSVQPDVDNSPCPADKAPQPDLTFGHPFIDF